MQTYILQENVLSDNLLYVADKGKVFKGGYVATIKEYTFATPWTDKEHIRRFKKKESMHKYLKLKYPDFNFYQ